MHGAAGGEPPALDADRKLGDAIQKEKDNSQHLETIHKVQYQALTDEHSPYKTLLRRSLEMESKAFRRREQDQLQHEAALEGAEEGAAGAEH